MLDEFTGDTAVTRRFNAATIKIIACITMFVDHLTVIFLESISPQTGTYAAYSVANGVLLDQIGRTIGRTAMPIFAFLIAEGMYYTSNRARYLLRMLLFAALSQIPFWMMDGGLPETLVGDKDLNVMVTLAYGMIAVIVLDFLLLPYLRQENREPAQIAWRLPVSVAAVAGICYLAEALTPCDYGACGVLAVVFFYVFREQRLIGIALSYAVLTAVFPSELYCVPGMVLVWLYNGQRGRQSKYFFYLFYPLHIAILLGLRYVLWGY